METIMGKSQMMHEVDEQDGIEILTFNTSFPLCLDVADENGNVVWHINRDNNNSCYDILFSKVMKIFKWKSEIISNKNTLNTVAKTEYGIRKVDTSKSYTGVIKDERGFTLGHAEIKEKGQIIKESYTKNVKYYVLKYYRRLSNKPVEAFKLQDELLCELIVLKEKDKFNEYVGRKYKYFIPTELGELYENIGDIDNFFGRFLLYILLTIFALLYSIISFPIRWIFHFIKNKNFRLAKKKVKIAKKKLISENIF